MSDKDINCTRGDLVFFFGSFWPREMDSQETTTIRTSLLSLSSVQGKK